MAANILIVDDSQTLRFTMRKMLHGLGYESIEADSGLNALAIINSHPEITLVLVDYNMPDMNGIELIAALKKQARGADLTCMIFTSIGEGASDLMAAAKKAGAVAWLTKPVQREHMEQVLLQFNQRKQVQGG